MCGIVGLWNGADASVVQRMAGAVAHRGPDGLDSLILGKHSLGASRLAIVGNPHASAIFHDQITGLAVLLNGEVYNVDLLRDELRHHEVVFKTDLETEVIANLYRRYGLAFASHLKGMFAIALLDGDTLVLARDRFGIKPLYYTQIGDGVAFGSEIKAVLSHPDVKSRLNLSAMEELVVFGYVYSAAETLFCTIKQVEPGTMLVFDSVGRRISRLAPLPSARYLSEDDHLEYGVAVAQLREYLVNALDRMLSHGHQAKGLYLSGGLDSTTLAVIAKAILGYPMTTFTLADSNDAEDLQAAREVAARLGTHHIERIVDLSDYVSALDDFIFHYETVVAGGVFDLHGAMAFHLLTKAVGEHVQVAFSGEGADELFGGYYWIYTHPLGFCDRMRGRLHGLPGTPAVRRFVDDLFPQPEDELLYRRNLLDALVKSGLANYHLQSVDRSSGAYGFEVRPAYLYDDLANFALSLPIEYRVLDKNTTKRILRDAFRPEFERLGLDWVLARQKLGMPAAVGSIARQIDERMAAAVSDVEVARHPLRRYLATKAEVYWFNKFAQQFHLEVPDGVQSRAT